MRELRRLHDAGELPDEAEMFFSATKPVEELYDCEQDPDEVKNLAGDPRYKATLERMRVAHLKWVYDTRDLGLVPEPILTERRAHLGSEYAILRQPGANESAKAIAKTAAMASSGIGELSGLLKACRSSDSVVRYWAATGLGNLGKPAAGQAETLMREALKDTSSAVRTAAARALCRFEMPGDALPVLITEMTKGTQWERLQAAIVLDEIDDQARPVIEQMREGLKYEKGFNSEGKYRVRVINRAINELQGTNHTVK